MCTGINSKIRHPLPDTVLQGYRGGIVQHSQEFQSVHDPLYKGKRVLVVGAGISGSDIASLLAREGNCASVTQAVRKMPYHVHVVSEKSRQPYDDILLARLPCWLTNTVPSYLSSQGLRAAVLADWPTQPTLETCKQAPNPDIRQCLFYPDRYWVQTVLEGKIKVEHAVASASGKTVTFTDGTKGDYDVIICATGYDADLSVLPQDVQDAVLFTNPVGNKPDFALYKMTLVPGRQDLAFGGFLYNYGPHFVMAEMQARLMAAVFSGRLAWPSPRVAEAGAHPIQTHRSQFPLNKGDLTPQFCDDLGRLLGVTPSAWRCLSNPSKMLLGPVYASIYRTNPAVDAPDVAERAQARFDELTSQKQVAAAEAV